MSQQQGEITGISGKLAFSSRDDRQLPRHRRKIRFFCTVYKSILYQITGDFKIRVHLFKFIILFDWFDYFNSLLIYQLRLLINDKEDSNYWFKIVPGWRYFLKRITNEIMNFVLNTLYMAIYMILCEANIFVQREREGGERCLWISNLFPFLGFVYKQATVVTHISKLGLTSKQEVLCNNKKRQFCQITFAIEMFYGTVSYM